VARNGEIYSKQISRLRFAALEMTDEAHLLNTMGIIREQKEDSGDREEIVQFLYRLRKAP